MAERFRPLGITKNQFGSTDGMSLVQHVKNRVVLGVVLHYYASSPIEDTNTGDVHESKLRLKCEHHLYEGVSSSIALELGVNRALEDLNMKEERRRANVRYKSFWKSSNGNSHIGNQPCPHEHNTCCDDSLIYRHFTNF